MYVCAYVCVYYLCITKWLSLCVLGVVFLKNTYLQQSHGVWDESVQGQREVVCLQERILNNGLRRSVPVTWTACVDAYGVLCRNL